MTFEESTLNPLRSCKGLCNKEMEDCPHLCAMICHNGPCNAPCEQTFAVVCKCGRQKQKWTCLQAQKTRKEQNIKEKDYKTLIACDEECEKLKAERLLQKQLEQAAREAEKQAKPTEKHVYVPKQKKKKARVEEEEVTERSKTIYYVLSFIILLLAIVIFLYMQNNPALMKFIN